MASSPFIRTSTSTTTTTTTTNKNAWQEPHWVSTNNVYRRRRYNYHRDYNNHYYNQWQNRREQRQNQLPKRTPVLASLPCTPPPVSSTPPPPPPVFHPTPLNLVSFSFSFAPELHQHPLLKSILYILGGLFIIGCITLSPVIFTTLVSIIVICGYIYSTVGLFFLIGYHSYMIITYLVDYGTEFFHQLYRKLKTYF